MRLTRVDHQLRRAAQPPQRLVQLLGVLHRHVPVLLAAQNQRRRDDVFDVGERRKPLPQRSRLPRQPQLVLPLVLVVVVTVIGGEQHFTRSGDRAREAIGLGDHVIGEDPAVGPAAHAQPLGVGEPVRDRVIDGGHDVIEILVAPIRPDRLAVVLTVAGGPARVGKDDRVPPRGEQLGLEVESVAVLRDGAAVDPQQRRAGGPAAPRTLINEGLDLRPVPTGKTHLLDGRELQTRGQAVVGVGELP